jgi:hypothetical protein
MAVLGSVVIQVTLSPAQLAWILMGASAAFAWWISLRLLRQG